MLLHKPKRYPKYAIITEIILFILLIALTLLVYNGINFRALGQSLLFIIVAAILYVATRYVIYEYTYSLSEDRFEVSRLAGRIPQVLCSVEIDEKDELIRISGQRELKQLYGKIRIENGCANLAPMGLYAYVTETHGKKTAILIESDELFALAITERINMKRLSAKNKEGQTENTDTEE